MAAIDLVGLPAIVRPAFTLGAQGAESPIIAASTRQYAGPGSGLPPQDRS